MAFARLTLKTWDTRPTHEKTQITEPAFISEIRATLEPRSASRQPSVTNSTPASNAFATDTSSTDLPLVANIGMNGDVGMSGLYNEFNADTFDWAFWDQLMRDPDQFIPAPS